MVSFIRAKYICSLPLQCGLNVVQTNLLLPFLSHFEIKEMKSNWFEKKIYNHMEIERRHNMYIQVLNMNFFALFTSCRSWFSD